MLQKKIAPAARDIFLPKNTSQLRGKNEYRYTDIQKGGIRGYHKKRCDDGTAVNREIAGRRLGERAVSWNNLVRIGRRWEGRFNRVNGLGDAGRGDSSVVTRSRGGI